MDISRYRWLESINSIIRFYSNSQPPKTTMGTNFYFSVPIPRYIFDQPFPVRQSMKILKTNTLPLKGESTVYKHFANLNFVIASEF